MRNILRYMVAVAAIIIVALASVMQFHHHGCHGAVFIPIYAIDEIAINDGNCGVHGAHHCLAHAGKAGHAHSHDDGNCSLHIDDTINSEQVILDMPAYAWMYVFDSESCDTDFLLSVATRPTVFRYYLSFIQDILLPPCGFRGPPAV